MSKLTQALNVCPTPERVAHAFRDGDGMAEIKTERAGVVAYQVRLSHALDRYHARGELAKDRRENDRRFDAGCILREAYESAHLEPSVIGRYSDVISGDGVQSASNHKIGAYEAWKRAVRAIGPVASGEVIDVCCSGETLKDRARMEILRRGLAVLADHYGLRA